MTTGATCWLRPEWPVSLPWGAGTASAQGHDQPQPAAAVRPDLATDEPAAAGLCLGVSLGALDQPARTWSARVRNAPREPMAEAEERSRGLCGGPTPRRSGYWRHSWTENPGHRSCGGGNLSRWSRSR